MVLIVEIVTNVGCRHAMVVHAQGVRGHQLHDPLAKKSNQQLCDSRDNQEGIDRDVLIDVSLCVGVMKGLEGFHHCIINLPSTVVVRL